MITEPTEDMLRAGQEALFEVCPEYTIEEREEVAREVWAAMEAAAGVFGGTPKTDPDYEHSEAALRDREEQERQACAALCEHEAEHNGLAAGWHLATLIRERSTPTDSARRTLQGAFQKMLDDAITYDKERAKRKAP